MRGRDFNFRVRRSVAGFVRGYTPPADFETIYSFPPYAGVVPAACALPGVDWSLLVWDDFTFHFTGSGATGTGAASGDSFFFDMVSGATSADQAALSAHAALPPYTGPSQNANITLTEILADPDTFFAIQVLQDSVQVALIFEGGPTTQDFTIAPGSASLIEINVVANVVPGVPFGQYMADFLVQNI